MIQVKLFCPSCKNVEEGYVDVDKMRRLLDGEPGPECSSNPICKSRMFLDQRPWLVKLTYFGARGKYYCDGYYTSLGFHLYEIFQEVEELLQVRTLPGLVEGAHFHVLIDVPGHPYNHPALILDPEAE
jgi:hypothetical protein